MIDRMAAVYVRETRGIDWRGLTSHQQADICRGLRLALVTAFADFTPTDAMVSAAIRVDLDKWHRDISTVPADSLAEGQAFYRDVLTAGMRALADQ